MVLVVRHAGVADVESKGQEEKLHRGPQQPRPLPAEPGLHVELGAGGRPSARVLAGLPPHRGTGGSSEARNTEPPHPSTRPFHRKRNRGPGKAGTGPVLQAGPGKGLTARNNMQYIPKEECPE